MIWYLIFLFVAFLYAVSSLLFFVDDIIWYYLQIFFILYHLFVVFVVDQLVDQLSCLSCQLFS